MGNKDTFSRIVKQRVIEALKAEGRTQKEMAADLDITPEHLSRCLTKGKISKTWLIAIADYLDCSPAWLSSEEGGFDSTFFAYQRQQIIDDQESVLTNLFHLLGYSKDQYNLLTETDRENLKTDFDLTIGYYVNKANRREGAEDAKNND